MKRSAGYPGYGSSRIQEGKYISPSRTKYKCARKKAPRLWLKNRDPPRAGSSTRYGCSPDHRFGFAIAHIRNRRSTPIPLGRAGEQGRIQADLDDHHLVVYIPDPQVSYRVQSPTNRKMILNGANILSMTSNWSLRLPVIVDDTSMDISATNRSSCVPYWPGWEMLRTNLMQVLQVSHHADVLVDVYLFEETWDQAIGIADQAGEWNYSLIEKVAEAVLPFRPDWVIQASRKQAEGLIAKTKSKYYCVAARWLVKIKQAYLSSGRKSDWQIYLDGLKNTYSRRPALQAELRKL
jgi:hypothetical protein